MKNVKLECGCETTWDDDETVYVGVYAWCNTHGDSSVIKIEEVA